MDMPKADTPKSDKKLVKIRHEVEGGSYVLTGQGRTTKFSATSGQEHEVTAEQAEILLTEKHVFFDVNDNPHYKARFVKV